MSTSEQRSGEPARPTTAAEARAAMEATHNARREEHRARIDAAFATGIPGRPTIVLSWLATLAQTVVSLLALADPDAWLGVFFGVCFVLFLGGVLIFAVDIVLAAARSTTDLMGIGGLFFLVGSAPRAVQVSLNGSLVCAVVLSIGATAARLSTPELAFGTLVPVLQLSLSGFWGVRHGHFGTRGDRGSRDG